MSGDRRHPLIPYDPACLRGFLRGRTPEAVTLLAGGKCNTNYRLDLPGGERVVLRLYARGDAAREVAIMARVRGLVPVPRELDRGEGWSVFTFMPGVPLAEAPEAVGAAAEVLTRLAAVTYPSPGQIGADGAITPWPFDGAGGYVETVLARDDVRAWLGPALLAGLRAVLAARADADPGDPRPRLVHGDFNPTNVLVHDGAVSAVLDWEFAHAGDRWMDVGNLIRRLPPAAHDAVAAGLRRGGWDLPTDWVARAEAIDVSSHLEFLTSARSEAFKRECVAWIARFVARNG